MTEKRVRDEIARAGRPPFFVATVTDVDADAGTITVQEGAEPPIVLPAALGTYPAVGATVFVMMNGDEPLVFAQLGDAGGTLTSIPAGIQIGDFIESGSYVAGEDGWHIDRDGTAEFNDVTVRGTLVAGNLTPDTVDIAPNGGGESGTGSWGSTNATVTQDSSTYRSGSHSIKVAWTSAAPHINYCSASAPDRLAIDAGAAYVWTFYLKRGGSTDRLFTPSLVYYDSGGSVVDMPNGEGLDEGAYAAVAGSDWTKYVFTSLAPDGAVKVGFHLQAVASSTDSIYIDDMTVVRTSSLEGGLAQPDALASRTEVFDQSGLLVPVGTVFPWAGIADVTGVYSSDTGPGIDGFLVTQGYPPGWLPCDGRPVSRTDYRRLFAVIGTTYGAGDGSTTFNVPDLRGRVPVGLDNLGGTDAGRLSVSNTLGGSGGEQTHTLTSGEIPSHTHTVGNLRDTGQAYSVTGSGHGTDWNGGSSYVSGSTGGGGAHNNMQPYLLLNFIIKA